MEQIKEVDLDKKAEELYALWYQGIPSEFGFLWRFLNGHHKIAVLNAAVKLSSNGPEIIFPDTVSLSSRYLSDDHLVKVSELLQGVFKRPSCKVERGAFTITARDPNNGKLLKVDLEKETIKVWIAPNDPLNYVMAFKFAEAVRDYIPELVDD
jgi:hypothetical protein